VGCDSGTKKAIDYAALDWKDDVYYLDGAPFTGIALQKQSKEADSPLKGRWEFRKGVAHGIVTEFDPDGTQRSETYYSNGVRHGTNTYWDENGELIKIQTYDHGKDMGSELFGSLKDAVVEDK